MKKIIITLLALLSFGISPAQFKVQDKQAAPEVVWRDALVWVTLYKQCVGNENYYIIGCRSTNKFDGTILLHLGKKESALASLSQLYDLYKKGEVYTLTDDNGETFTAQGAPLSGFYIFKKGYAGYGAITLNQLQKMRTAINDI